MKLTFLKILVCTISMIVSIAACVCGMYMVFLANMLFGYRFLFCLIFMLNPIAVIFMIRYMFRKPEPKEGAEGGETPGRKKRRPLFGKKDQDEPEADEIVPIPEPEASSETPQADTSYSGTTYPEPTYTEPTVSQETGYEPDFSESAFSDASYPDLSNSGTSYEETPAIDAFDEQPLERTTAPITEKSVEKVKKISLIRKKQPSDRQ